MRLKEGIHDKPSLLDFCKYLNLTVGNASGGQLRKKELVTNAVGKLLSDILMDSKFCWIQVLLDSTFCGF